jgi:hypothetical protein
LFDNFLFIFPQTENDLHVTLSPQREIVMRDASLLKATVPELHMVPLLTVLLLSVAHALAQCDLTHDLHASSICGLIVGMKPALVLETMKRPPDIGQEQQGDIVSGWKLTGGDLLSVRFRNKQYVSALMLDFHPVRRAADLGLPTALEDQYGSGGLGETIGLARRANPSTNGTQLKDNPKLILNYHRDYTQNAERVIWYREETVSAGYKLEIGFYSASRLKAGERVYQNDVATKYITVRKPELATFGHVMAHTANPSESKSAQH